MKRLNAFTLPEVLIVMVVTSIIIISLFSGLSLLKQYVAKVSNSSIESLENSSRLDFLNEQFYISDSIVYSNNQYIFYRNNKSSIIDIDSLFNNVVDVKNYFSKADNNKIDSLTIIIKQGINEIEMKFCLNKKPNINYQEND
ncbi:hypothetical protein SDC9_47242 [bioreactor metagenome]|uniref:Prepilin-type N-terminal cleavage/methylation domain-containing protein n=1 Tax=bioreactor metagenome TaxID=1076179 RepID=A0A644WB04_9ZZZZ